MKSRKQVPSAAHTSQWVLTDLSKRDWGEHSRCPGIGWLNRCTYTRLYWIKDTVLHIHSVILNKRHCAAHTLGYNEKKTLCKSVYMGTEHCIYAIWWQYDNYIIINIGLKHRHKCISKCFYFLRIYRLRSYFYDVLLLFLHCTLYKCDSIIPQALNCVKITNREGC